MKFISPMRVKQIKFTSKLVIGVLVGALLLGFAVKVGIYKSAEVVAKAYVPDFK